MSLTEIYFLSRTNKTLIRGATLIHGMTRALSRIPTYPRQMTSACNVAEYFVKSHLTAPSAVHLTTCFLPDSQQHRLSVKASLSLSPLQRFELLNLDELQHAYFSLSTRIFISTQTVQTRHLRPRRKTNEPIPQRKQVSASLRLLLLRLRAAEPVFEISVAERR